MVSINSPQSSPPGVSLLASQKKAILAQHTSRENASPPAKYPDAIAAEGFNAGAKMDDQPWLPILRVFVSHQHSENVPIYSRQLNSTSQIEFRTATVFPR